MTGETANAASDTPFAAGPGAGRRRGRPTKREAASLGPAILEIAFRQFLDAGFSATSMDSIAAEAGVSKRTLYDRFPSKMHVFEAALHHRAKLDFESFRWFETHSEPFDAVLLDTAKWLADRILGPSNIALYRLLAAEAHRAPELSRYSEEKVVRPIIVALAGLFNQAMERGDIVDLPADFLANQFFQAVCGQQVRERIYGVHRLQEGPGMDEWIANAVALFLNGARRRQV